MCLMGLMCLMGMSSCSKQKTCRCAVTGTTKVRIIQIDKGECSQLSHYDYQTPMYVAVTDSLLCTDYEFLIDSIYED